MILRLNLSLIKGVEFAKSLGEDYTIYEEAESGASLIARTELERLLRDIQNDIITKVWAIELTRLSRSVEDFQIIKKIFTGHNIELFINNIKTDLSQADHRFLFNIDAAVSEYERERIVERVKRSIEERKDRGMLHLQKCLGYDLQYDENGDSKYVINKTEAKIVKMIFKKYSDRLSLHKIAMYLKNHQFKMKLDNRWTRRAVLNILQHFTYTGYNKTSNGKVGKSKLYPSIISLDEYKELWANYRKGTKIPNPPYRRYQSSGIIACSICRAKWMYSSHEVEGKRYEYYKADHFSRCTNRGKWIHKEYVDDALDRALLIAPKDPYRVRFTPPYLFLGIVPDVFPLFYTIFLHWTCVKL
ncbi:hypothetical protein ES703_104350 [subsurface metagenome]